MSHEERDRESANSSLLGLLGRKRVAEPQPLPSMTCTCTSLIPKVRRRARSRREFNSSESKSVPICVTAHEQTRQRSDPSPLEGKGIRDFQITVNERNALESLREKLNVYLLLTCENTKISPQEPLLNMQEYLRSIKPCKEEESNVAYLSVLDAKADSKDTIMQVIHDIHKRYIEGQNKQWVIIEGEAKVYELLQSLKNKYGDELKWVLPYPGDWHLLMNFQHVLMKVYFDAGLKHMSQAAGYPSASIKSCSQFKSYSPLHIGSLGVTVQSYD